MEEESVLARALGQFPISIATSLSIEALLGIYPEVEGKPAPYRGPNLPLYTVESIWFSVRTLYRNIVNSYPKGLPVPDPTEVSDLINMEMNIIDSIISEKSYGRCSSTFYLCSYGDLSKIFPHAALRPFNTVVKDYPVDHEVATYNVLSESSPSVDFRELVTKIPPDINTNSLMFTHLPVDLLSQYSFKSLALLESHTGVIKSRLSWNTKLHDGKNLHRMPFDRMTLQLFGDGKMFKSTHIKVRKHLIELADKYKWSSETTKDYIISSIKKERDPVLESFVIKHY